MVRIGGLDTLTWPDQRFIRNVHVRWPPEDVLLYLGSLDILCLLRAASHPQSNRIHSPRDHHAQLTWRGQPASTLGPGCPPFGIAGAVATARAYPGSATVDHKPRRESRHCLEAIKTRIHASSQKSAFYFWGQGPGRGDC